MCTYVQVLPGLHEKKGIRRCAYYIHMFHAQGYKGFRAREASAQPPEALADSQSHLDEAQRQCDASEDLKAGSGMLRDQTLYTFHALLSLAATNKSQGSARSIKQLERKQRRRGMKTSVSRRSQEGLLLGASLRHEPSENIPGRGSPSKLMFSQMMGFEKTVQRLRAREARVLARRDRLQGNAQSFRDKVRGKKGVGSSESVRIPRHGDHQCRVI